jgi:hypothetical protein
MERRFVLSFGYRTRWRELSGMIERVEGSARRNTGGSRQPEQRGMSSG